MSLRSLTIVFLLIFGLTPLAVTITLNLPPVLDQATESIEREKIDQLHHKFIDLNNLLNQRREGLRVLARVPGVLDLVKDADKAEVSPAQVKKRLPRLLTRLFQDHEEIERIIIYNREGVPQLAMTRNNGLLASTPEPELADPDRSSPADLSKPPGHVYLNRILTSAEDDNGATLSLALNIAVDRKTAGHIRMDLNLSLFLHHFPHHLFLREDGRYLVQAGQGETEKNAFADFPGLEEILASGEPAILPLADTADMAFYPIISCPNNNSLWAGMETDTSAISDWLKQFRQQMLIIVIIIALATLLITILMGQHANRLSNQLLATINNLLKRRQPIELDWQQPRELKKMALDLNRLADSYLKDLAARKEDQQQIAALQQQQKRILDNAAGAIIGLDPNGMVTFANPAAATMLGYEQHELVDNDLHNLVHLTGPGQPLARETCPICQMITNNKEQVSGETTYYRSDHVPVNVWFSASATLDERDERTVTVLCLEDITTHKRHEQELAKLQEQLIQSQKMEAIGNLAGGVAHDFNNLLTIISGYGDLIESNPATNDDNRKNIKEILTASRRGADLSRQLLSFSRRRQINTKTLDLNELIRGMHKMLTRLLGEHIELIQNLEPDREKISADPGMLGQVIMNLVVNSRDAIGGRGRITISTRSAVFSEDSTYFQSDIRPGHFICLTIEDDGCGMSQETARKIFEPFFTTKEEGKGTGLGLAVAYAIIKQHQGWVHVYSEPGQGTSFKIYLPATAGEIEKDSARITCPPPAAGEKILLVEDEEMVRNVTSAILEHHGYQVMSAATVNEGLNLWQNNDFALVISDVMLPDGTGLDLVMAIQKQDPAIPIIMCSGYSDDLLHQDIIKGRDLPFIRKPFSRLQLIQAVAECQKKEENAPDNQ